MSESPIRILLVDDHCMFLDALRSVLMTVPQFELLGTATHAEQALTMARELSPDIVLCDVELPGSSGLVLAAELHRRFPAIRVAFLTGYFSTSRLESALKVRVRGYLLKTDEISDLIFAIQQIAQGQQYFSDSIRNTLTIDEQGVPHVNQTTALADLSPLQTEILRQLALGLSVKQVAKLMHVTPKAIDNHKNRIMQRLGIHDRVVLARFAIDQGLILRDPTDVVS